MVTKESFVRAFEALNKIKPKRNFTQSVELMVALRDVDLKKPENRFRDVIFLPKGLGDRPSKICVIGERDLALKAKEAGADLVMGRGDLESLAGNKRELKKLASRYDFFLVQPDMMPLVGRLLGPFLGPRGKAPIPMPFNVDVKSFIERYRRAVNVRTKDQPYIHVIIGRENMRAEDIAENALSVLEALKKKYRIPQNVKSIYVKMTMSPAMKVKIR